MEKELISSLIYRGRLSTYYKLLPSSESWPSPQSADPNHWTLGV